MGAMQGIGGLWRSLVARFVWDEDVAGSNPVSPTGNISIIGTISRRQFPAVGRTAW